MDSLPTETITISFAAKKAKKTCKKGYPCGASCISKSRNCKKALKGQAKTYNDWLASQAKPKSKKSSPAPLPSAPDEDLFDDADSSVTGDGIGSIFDVEKGHFSRTPLRFVEGDSDADPAVVKEIAKHLKKSKKNLTPVFVEHLGGDSYKAVQNGHILEAARQAGLDFVWTTVIDNQMRQQILAESGKAP